MCRSTQQNPQNVSMTTSENMFDLLVIQSNSGYFETGFFCPIEFFVVKSV